MPDIHSILKQYWGYHAFRPLQEDIIDSILEGKDTLALMPTGGGKSLCYQVPAIAMNGLCLVISPLIALMKDQVENLRKKNITAFAVYSGMSRKEVINTFKVATESNCKFLYVSPERLETALFKEYLPGLGVNLIAVDEAHCISQWGYDFRPPYLRIATLREELPNVPVLALTASATPAVQKDIVEKLMLPASLQKGLTPGPFHIFKQSFERPNLSYSTFNIESKINKIIEILMKVPGSSIIYCKSRKRTKEISELLQLQNIAADFYHAGLEQEVRSKKQEDWINNKIRVIVCTNAFGMGIDKPDVRTVIHADVPDCLENYYQEAGRGGRDGKTSFAALLYNEIDILELDSMATLRFPTLKQIREVYQSVANYLQIPTGASEGQYYDFDMNDFLKKFKQSSHTVLYSLKALEQDGWLSFNEQVFLPSTIMFTTTKQSLYDFEKTHPQAEPIIKSLLRAYEGIFDQHTPISEKVIADLINKTKDEAAAHLHALHKHGLIEYKPQKDKPQISLLKSRIKADDITIDISAYEKRKEQYLLRAKQMQLYVKETAACRSRIIGSYFGDDQIRACGICDNCLRQKSVTLTPQELQAIHHRIVDSIKQKSSTINSLLENLQDVKKEKAWKVLEFLQAENKIEMMADGYVRLK
jgi:ATP-dependent DNA helicase RecQ